MSGQVPPALTEGLLPWEKTWALSAVSRWSAALEQAFPGDHDANEKKALNLAYVSLAGQWWLRIVAPLMLLTTILAAIIGFDPPLGLVTDFLVIPLLATAVLSVHRLRQGRSFYPEKVRFPDRTWGGIR
jgi:hypothetical protein